ncbi:hypothetical protein DO73_2777 [Burkholderia pseudomallei]|nr:hypothetical protein DO73_2777 [Burkholderia pseudomallei]
MTPEQASQDLAASFMRDVRALVALKRELLPGVTTFIDSVRLEAIDDKADRLMVTTSVGEEARSIPISREHRRSGDDCIACATGPTISLIGLIGCVERDS